MAHSQPLPDNTQMKLRQNRNQSACESFGCNSKVTFRFEGCHSCRHNVCGSCLSSFYNTREQPICCPKCVQQNEKHISYITYESFIKTFIDADICTTCFTSRAIYQGSCGHLLCEECVHALSRDNNFIRCSIRNCSALLVGEKLADALMWKTFKVPKFQFCVGHSGIWEEKAMVVIKQCNHGYCVTCLKDMSIATFDVDKIHCKKNYCHTVISRQTAERLLTKLEDTHFMTTVCLSLSPVQCFKCKQFDRKDSTKARLRNRRCYYDHAFCLECLNSSYSDQSADHRTGAMDKRWICPVHSCNMETPFECIVEMRNAITNSNGLTGLFIRKAHGMDKCSQCDHEKGIITIIACHHSLCEGCLRRAVDTNTRWYHECEGDCWSCKSMVPTWVLKKALKTNLLVTPASNSDERSENFDALRPPNIDLEKSLDEETCCLHLKAQIKSCLPVENYIWKRNGKVMQVANNAKYCVAKSGLTESVLVISSLDKTDNGRYTFSAENRSGRGESNAVSFKIPYDPPIVTLELQSSHGSCKIKADIYSKWSVTKTRWLQNGGTVRSKENIATLKKKEPSHFSQTIELNIFLEEVKGYYQCVADSVAGEGGSGEVFVNITEKPPDVHLMMEISKIIQSVKFWIEKSTSSLNSVTWLKNGEVLDISNQDKFYSWRLMDKARLSISHVDKSDEGEYQIVAQNSGGEGKSNTIMLQIENECDTPKLKLKQPSKSSHAIILSAEVDSEWPIISRAWRKNGELLHMSDIYEEFHGSSFGKLWIYNTNEAGKFQLVAENVAGVGKSNVITLCYKEIPVVDLKASVNKIGLSVTFSGDITSSSPLKQLIWLKDDKAINMTDTTKYSIWKSSENHQELTVFSVDKSDEGKYQLLAENMAGEGNSKPYVLNIENDSDRPNVKVCEPFRDYNAIILTAEVNSEWPITSLDWYKDGEMVQISNIYSVVKDEFSVKLHIFNLKEAGNFQVIASNVAGTSKSDSIRLCKEDINDSTNNSGRPDVTKEKQSKLQTIMPPYRGGPDCDMCNYTAVTKVSDCSHHLCWHCLMILNDSSETVGNKIRCICDCPSWLTQNTVRKFLQNDENSKKHTSLYFKLVYESGKCDADGCHNQGCIRLFYCGHTYCVKCTLECGGTSICEKNSIKCVVNPPQKNALHMQQSLANNEINPFLFKYQGNKTCNLCRSNIAAFEIFWCGHRFCEEHIELAKLPFTEKLPFHIGKCLQERCEELFKFPIIPLAKEKEESYTNTECGSRLGKNTERKDFPQEIAPTDLEKDKYSNNLAQHPEKKRKHIVKTNDSSKKPKTVVSRFTQSTGLSNVGLSCYRNAILQTLAETPFFEEMLTDGIAKRSTGMSWISLLSTILGRIRAKDTGGQGMLEVLHHFHYAFNEKNSGYREYQQEDTLSFLTSILNGLHDEFKELDKTEDSSTKHMDPTVLFQGSLKDNYKCKDCKKIESFDGEEFYSLPLPEKESTTMKGKITLGACLGAFLNKEDIDAIPCSACKSFRLTKQLMIANYPVVLVLQICKLEESMYAADSNAFQKNTNNVEFGEDFRDLKAQKTGAKDVKEALKHYRLFSVVEHIGSANSGHYICYVRRQDSQKWNRCDDSYVTEVKLQEVLKSNAYLLFYEKCDTALK